MAFARTVTSPPAASQISAIALIKEIFVARKEFAATFTSSEVGRSATTQGVCSDKLFAYTCFKVSSALLFVTPTTRRFGLSVSSTAKPSRKNSGFHAKSSFGFTFRSRSRSAAAVPTGTVDLPTTSEPSLIIFAIESRAPLT